VRNSAGGALCLQGSHRRLKLVHYAMRRNRPWCRQAAFGGFGFLRSYRRALRAGSAAADPAGSCRIAPPGAAPGRRTAVFAALTV